jgi:hypothetical protein
MSERYMSSIISCLGGGPAELAVGDTCCFLVSFLFVVLIGICSLVAPSRIRLSHTRQATTPSNTSGYRVLNVAGCDGKVLNVAVPTWTLRRHLNSATNSSYKEWRCVGVCSCSGPEETRIVERPVRKVDPRGYRRPHLCHALLIRRNFCVIVANPPIRPFFIGVIVV